MESKNNNEISFDKMEMDEYLSMFKNMENFNFEEGDFFENSNSVNRANLLLEKFSGKVLSRIPSNINSEEHIAALVCCINTGNKKTNLTSDIKNELIKGSKEFVKYLIDHESYSRNELFKEYVPKKIKYKKIDYEKNVPQEILDKFKISITDISEPKKHLAMDFIESIDFGIKSLEELIKEYLYQKNDPSIMKEGVVLSAIFLMKELERECLPELLDLEQEAKKGSLFQKVQNQ